MGKLNLEECQRYLDSGKSWTEVSKLFGVNRSYIGKCVKLGKLKSNTENKNQWRNNHEASVETRQKLRNRQLGKTLTEETKQKISNTVERKIMDGTWHDSLAKHIRHYYKGVWLYGTWELEYAKWLDLNGIEWKRPTESFPYVFRGKSKRYTPDFFLVKEQEYVEVKGYETEKDRAKWEQFPLKHKVLKYKDLTNLGILIKR